MSLTDRGFGADTGAVPPDLAAALASYDAQPAATSALPNVIAALQASRLLLAMVEVDADTFHDDHDHHHDHHDHDHGDHEHHDNEKAMAAVSMQRPDGRRGLLAFTGVEPLARFDATARPLPVTTREAAETAQRDGATALVIDVAGPVRLVIEGEDLIGLAAGWALGSLGERSVWIRPSAE